MRTGLHANDTRDHNKILDYYRRSGANVFKTLVFHADLMAKLKEMGVTVIGRVHFDQQPLGGSDAKNNMRRIIETAARHPNVDFWEGYNECYQGPQMSQDATARKREAEDARRYTAWEIERTEKLEEIGAKAMLFSFSCGTPDLDTDAWPIFRPAIERAMPGGHALGLHEYAGPYMQYMLETPAGENQWRDERFTGASANGMWDPNVNGWLCLRYRKVWERYLAPWGCGKIPIFITEGGIDDATPRPGPPGKGYKPFEDTEWAKLPGIGDYADQRYWYMVQATHDDGNGRPLVGGVVDFGWEGTATGWPDFDLSTDAAMTSRIIQREQAIPRLWGSSPAPAPVPAPAPASAPAPAPSPRPPAPVGTGVEPRIEVVSGQGWYAIARALLGRQPTGREVEELMNANPTVAGLRVGQWLRSPWHKVVGR